MDKSTKKSTIKIIEGLIVDKSGSMVVNIVVNSG